MKARILVIDDDKVAGEFLQEALLREGYEVSAYTSAIEALRQDLSHYDLLMSDIRMPGMVPANLPLLYLVNDIS